MDSSFWRIVRVLGIGVLVLLAVVASIWLARADVLMTSRSPRETYSLPTPTLFPTTAPTIATATSGEPTRISPPSPTEMPVPSATTVREVTPTPTPCAPAEGWMAYTVQAGDTYFELARRGQTNIQGLLAGNCLEETGELEAGSTIYLPPVAVAQATPAPVVVTCRPQSGWPIITVQPGDTLYALSIRYGSTVVGLMKANCLTNDLVKVGERLHVPGPIVVYPTQRPTVVWPTWTPAPTITPPPTVTSQPTLTPTPSDTPTATLEPSPTLEPTETPVLIPTWTPPPTGPLVTPTPTVTPELAATPTSAPTDTPAPAVAPVPSDTPLPTATAPSDPDP